MDEEDSPVVKEIPVFISQSLAQSLVLYQYPLEHVGLNTSNSNVIQCSIKQNPHEVMLELERNTDSANYCVSRGEQIAINVDGKDATSRNPDEVMFPTNLMDRQMFVSRSFPNQNCAVGVLHDNELHLTPLETVALLRPSFKYLDKSDKRVKTESKDGNEGENSGEEEEESKQITVKFARQENERTKKAREKSFSYVNQQTAKEVWYKSNYYDKKSDKSELEMNKLYCNKISDKVNDMKMESDEVLNIISKDEQDASNNSSHGDSLLVLKQLPILDKVKKLLIDARLMQFSQLTKNLGCTNEIQDYLKVIQQVAVLVQGCWVVQSDIIYYKETLPGGVSAYLMRSARDYILYLFTKNRIVRERINIAKVVKLPPDTVKEILEELAVLVPSRGWEFKLQTDNDFIKMYPEIVQRQYIKWEMKHEQLIESFKNTETNFSSSPPVRHRRKSCRDSSFSSDNESGAEGRRNGYQISGHKIRRTKKHSVSFSDMNGENT